MVVWDSFGTFATKSVWGKFGSLSDVPPEIPLAGGILVSDLSATPEKRARLPKLGPRRPPGRAHLLVPRRPETLPSRHRLPLRF